MPTHTTLGGRTIEFPEPTAEVAAFLSRVRAAAEDATVSRDAMISLVYGPDNPIHDPGVLPGRAMVTPEVWANPVYHVLADLVGVKEVRLGLVDLTKAHAAFTVDVPTAAKELGVSVQAVRLAVEDRRLSAIYDRGQWWIHPNSLASFRLSRAGKGKPGPAAKPKATPATAAAAVVARVGSSAGASLSVRVVGGELAAERKEGNAVVGRFPAGWKRAVVRTTSSRGTRAVEVEPSPGSVEAIEHGSLYVRGAFKIVAKHNTTAAANAAWRTMGKDEIAG